MTNTLIIATIMVSESVFIWWASRGNEPYRLRGFVVIQMILIALFAPKLFTVVGHTTNVAGAFHASAFVVLAIICKKSGKAAAHGTIPIIIYSLSVVYVLTWLLALVETDPQNASTSAAIDGVVRYHPPVIFASVTATVIGIAVLIIAMEKLPQWCAPVAAVVMAQTVNSAIFYPLAFSNLSINILFDIMLTGLMFKLLCSIVLIPAYLLGVRK